MNRPSKYLRLVLQTGGRVLFSFMSRRNFVVDDEAIIEDFDEDTLSRLRTRRRGFHTARARTGVGGGVEQLLVARFR